MTGALKRIIESQISLLRGFDFEEFIKDLMLLRHGVSGFIPTRPKKDKGCDGIIVNSSTIIACYGPDAYDEKAYSKKVKEDYDDYKEHWKTNYPNWQFVFNGKLGPNAITAVTGVHPGSTPWGLDGIMSIIVNELNSTQQRKVAELLGIPKTQISQDYLEEILENLLNKTVTDPLSIYQFKKDSLVNVEDKIRLNYNQNDVNVAMQEFEDMISEIYETGKLFKAFEDEEQDRIKSRIRADYKNANGSFKERLKIITDNYLHQYSAINDDIYRHNVTAVLLYLFEQCLIGEIGE
ncbi:MAG TPA: hypothetical protein VL442_10725 [Mucilaginibacter sp.]|jgi:hypothetical protein|nr:hypothetical protein [Mucilaginibacter sp.]